MKCIIICYPHCIFNFSQESSLNKVGTVSLTTVVPSTTKTFPMTISSLIEGGLDLENLTKIRPSPTFQKTKPRQKCHKAGRHIQKQ